MSGLVFLCADGEPSRLTNGGRMRDVRLLEETRRLKTIPVCNSNSNSAVAQVQIHGCEAPFEQ